MHYLVSLLNSPLQPLTYTYDEELKLGNIVEVTLSSKTKLGVVISKTIKPEFTCSEIISVKDEFFDETTFSLAKFISEYYVCSLGDALNLFVPLRKNTLHVNKKVQTNIILSLEQQKAYEFLKSHDKSLLFGDTGSGKTEVYIKLIEECINFGKSAIFLMPEIGLTPQTKKDLKMLLAIQLLFGTQK